MNVQRAVEQYRAGSTGTGNVGDAGWDFRRSGGVGDRFEYAIGTAVQQYGYIAATVVWDRVVTKTGSTMRFDQGDQFFPYADVTDVISNLDLYVLPANSNDIVDAVASSTTTEDNVEHIFFKAQAGGQYKIVVLHNGAPFASSDGLALGLDAPTDFAVAWWSYEPTLQRPGDYDRDGDIDQADYTVFTAGYGQQVFPGRGADGNLDGFVNAADYTVWRDELGAPSVAVPEPGTALLFAMAAVFGIPSRRVI
ncbi:MAG: hypothetical protein ACRCT8_07880 [Lacipirellulaceae bacterium]